MLYYVYVEGDEEDNFPFCITETLEEAQELVKCKIDKTSMNWCGKWSIFEMCEVGTGWYDLEKQDYGYNF